MMADFLYLGIVLALFLVSLALVALCKRLHIGEV
jgi:hypothetical protein